VLPNIQLKDVFKVIDAEVKDIRDKRGVKISYKFMQNEQAPLPTPTDAPVVLLLEEALKRTLGLEPVVGGVGGGTCAAYFRKAGIPAVVWCQEADVAHMPDEYADIAHMTNEAKVFALMMTGSDAH